MFSKRDKSFSKNKANLQLEIKPGSDEFYKAASDWRSEIYDSQRVWLNRSLLANAAQFALLLIALVAILVMLPLKQTTPFLYAFDKATGEVTKIGELEPTKLTANWEMTRFFLIHYVVNRESYDYYNIDHPYQIAWAMSSPDIRKQYDAQVDSDVPTSPYKTYGKSKYITVRVLSVSRLSKDTASVRYEKTLHDRDADTQQVSEEEAIVKWKYVQPETTQKMLDRDPLGFQVVYYQVTQVNLDTNLTNNNS